MYGILGKDNMFSTALEMDLPDLVNLCRTSKRMNDLFCENNIFWYNKLVKNYGLDLYSPNSNENKDAYLKIYNLLKENPTEAYEIAVINESLPLIKLAIRSGAPPNVRIDNRIPLIRIIFNEKIFDYLVDKSIVNKLTASMINKNFNNLFNKTYRKSDKCYLAIKLYDKILPESAKYLKNKKFWKVVLEKLEYFKKECPNFLITYNKWKDFYVKLTKED